jgi:hypothetical protein
MTSHFEMMDAVAPKPGRRGLYKKHNEKGN